MTYSTSPVLPCPQTAQDGAAPPCCSHILIVEDDTSQLHTLTLIMQAEGFEVVGCQSAAAALTQMRCGAFGVAIVDLRLPDLDGVSLAEQLRARDESLRIIVHTAYSSFESAKTLLNLGAFAYVEKLGDPQELVRHVHRAMREHMRQYTTYLEAEVKMRTRALRASEQWLELAQSAANMATWEWDVHAGTFRHSRGFPALFGLPPEQEMSLDLWTQCLHPDDRQQTRARLRHALSTGEAYNNEYRVVWPDGTVRWLNSLGQVTLDDTGRPCHIIGASLDTTQRKQAEAALQQAYDTLEQRVAERTAALQQSQALLHSIIDNTTALIYAKHRDGRYALINRQGEKRFNRPRAEILGKTDADLLPSAVAAALSANDQHVLHSGEVLETEEHIVHATGARTYLSIKVPLYDTTGTPHMVCGISTDITARKQATARRQQQTEALMGLWQAHIFKPEAFQDTLQEITRVAARTLQTERVSIWLFNEEHTALHCLALYEKQVHRYSADFELIAAAYPAYVRALEDSRTLAVHEAQTDPRMHEFVTSYLHPLGITSLLHAPIRIEEGVIGVLCLEHLGPPREWFPDEQMCAAFLADLVAMAVQVNKRFQAEQALRASEERLELALHGADLGLWDWDIRTGALIHNKRSVEMAGYPQCQLQHPVDTWTALVHPDDLPRLRQAFAAHFRGDTPMYEAEYRMQARADEWRWIFARGRVVERDAQGAPLRAVGTQLDITERKRAEQEQTRLVTILETTPDLVAIVHAQQQTFVYLNQAGRCLLGFNTQEPISKVALTDCVRADTLESTLLPTLRRQETWTGELTLYHRDGHTVAVLMTAICHPAGPGEEPLFSLVARDMTAYKQLEQQFLQAQKLEAVGRLAGGVAHDFNNLLTAVIGYSDLMLARLQVQDPLLPMVAEIKKAGQRAASLTRQLLAFSRKQVLAPLELNLNTVVMDMEKMLQCLIGEDIALTLQLDPALHNVRVDPNQMEQVIMNLAVNARDAMPTGGTLVISTRNVVLNARSLRDHSTVLSGPYSMLVVTDTGCGMDASTQAHMFEPFFTTKELGKGTGLGLATVFGIVKQSGGHVEVSSKLGQGTTLTMYLPQVLTPSPASPTGLLAAEPVLSGSETILVVEDEPQLQALVGLTLQRAGYTVLEAQNGQAALQLCAAHSGPLHLLLTDVIMPGMSGRQLSKHLNAMQSPPKLLFMSGYTDEALDQHGILMPGIHLLSKPFTPDALLRKVREVLDSTV